MREVGNLASERVAADAEHSRKRQERRSVFARKLAARLRTGTWDRRSRRAGDGRGVSQGDWRTKKPQAAVFSWATRFLVRPRRTLGENLCPPQVEISTIEAAVEEWNVKVPGHACIRVQG